MVYVGTRNPTEHVNNIISLVQEKNPRSSFSLSLTKMRFFWLRLEIILRMRSIARLGNLVDTDHILREVSAMDDNGKSWVAIGRGSSEDIVGVEGSKFMECLNNFLGLEEYVGQFGFLGVLRTALEIPLGAEPCDDSKDIRYREEEAVKAVQVCEKCKLPMKKFVTYE